MSSEAMRGFAAHHRVPLCVHAAWPVGSGMRIVSKLLMKWWLFRCGHLHSMMTACAARQDCLMHFKPSCSRPGLLFMTWLRNTWPVRSCCCSCNQMRYSSLNLVCSHRLAVASREQVAKMCSHTEQTLRVALGRMAERVFELVCMQFFFCWCR